LAVSERKLYSLLSRVINGFHWLVQFNIKASLKDLDNLTHSMRKDILGAFE
jgi:hypothetical protein